MNLSPLKARELITDALNNDQLRHAVEKATKTVIASRQKAVDDIPYWELLRQKLHGLKKEVIDHLDDYLIQFESTCKKNKIAVHWAKDASDARQIIIELSQKNKVQKVVKSKSLTTEEIGLNHELISHGIDTLETDLGEYIVQLLGQIPSHLTMPALHLTRKEIGRLFEKKLGIPYTDEPTELLATARSKLREHFMAADMGISGANFGIADSGCFCVIENEANAHLTISLPRIHVAVMGIEKLIPHMDALPYFLKALAPSATGQKSSTYVNFIGGPTREKYGEGPEEVHIVLLDNGRSRILKEPKLRETLFCIRCGACLNICPVYQQIGGHAYGWVYMGPIGASLIPQFLGASEGRYAPFMSSLCRACYDTCPMGINLPEHLLLLRNRIVESKHSSNAEQVGMSLWAFLASHPKLYQCAMTLPGKLQTLTPKESAFPIPGFSGERKFGRFDSKGFKKRYYEWIENKDRKNL